MNFHVPVDVFIEEVEETVTVVIGNGKRDSDVKRWELGRDNGKSPVAVIRKHRSAADQIDVSVVIQIGPARTARAGHSLW